MKRLGRLHRLLLDSLPSAPSWVSIYELLWEVARKDREVREGQIRTSYASSVTRSLRALVERGDAIQCKPRQIQSWDALCRAYPYRTRHEVVLDMRRHLLPLAQAWAQQTSSPKKATKVEYAVYRRRTFARSEQIEAEWRTVDVNVKRLFGIVNADEIEAVFALLARGRELFDPSLEVTWGRTTFVEAYDAALPIARRVDREIADQLEHFARKVFPLGTVRIALLKRDIYKCVTQHTYEIEALLPDFEQFLMQQEPTYVSSLAAQQRQVSPQGRKVRVNRNDLFEDFLMDSQPPSTTAAGIRGWRLLDQLLLRNVVKAVPVYARK
ncbi:hypothetical protein [Sorangium sp. So ce426]|uniref:hypothetical protein n=1 Tax=Sorangium sp. So ce426 TaxID=3133312 RepID=UPI003F5CB490